MRPGTGNPENNLTAGCSDSEFIVMSVLPLHVPMERVQLSLNELVEITGPNLLAP